MVMVKNSLDIWVLIIKLNLNLPHYKEEFYIMKIGFEEGENYHISNDAKVKVTSYVYGKTKVTQKLKIII